MNAYKLVDTASAQVALVEEVQEELVEEEEVREVPVVDRVMECCVLSSYYRCQLGWV